jgi:chlorite dismutase
MLWIHAETSDALQDAFSRFRRTALGDFEWLLAFEADDLDRIVDLMRHLRGSETRRHVREEIPFYTGKRRSVAEIVNALP